MNKAHLASIAAALLMGCAAGMADASVAARYEDCNPALAEEMIAGGALVVEVRTNAGSATIPGAVAIHGDVLRAVSAEARSRCGVVLVSEDGARGAFTKMKLAAAGYRVTHLGELGAWPHVAASTRELLVSPQRARCELR